MEKSIGANGYENVTVAQITERAGLTRRTFSRYFADKRDVLFAGSDQLPAALAEAVSQADAGFTPFEALLAALGQVGDMLATRIAPHAAQRQAIVDSSRWRDAIGSGPALSSTKQPVPNVALTIPGAKQAWPISAAC